MRDNSKTYTITSPSSSITLAPSQSSKSWVESCEFGSSVAVEIASRPQAHGGFIDPGYLGHGVWDAQVRMYGNNQELQASKKTLFSVVTEMFGEDGSGTVSWEDDSQYATSVIASAPVAYYRLDEPSISNGTTLTDEMGAYNGTYAETTAIVTDASLLEGDAAGYSQTFPAAAGSYASIPYTVAMNTSSFTWSCLFKISDLSGANQSAMLNTINVGQSKGAALYYDAGVNAIVAQIVYAAGPSFNEATSSTGFLVENQLYHAVVTYDAATLKLYIDGVLIDSAATSYAVNTTEAFTIGGGGPWDTGGEQIDEVAVWNTAFTATQVRELYEQVFTTKQLTGYIGALEGPKDDNGTWLTHLQLITEKPFAENETAIVYDSDALDTEGGGFVIPFEIPFTFTGSSGGSVTITNTGDFYMFPVFRLYGPLSSPQLVNVTTGKRLAWTGSIADGDYWEVDLFDKTVLLNGVERILSLDIEQSDWFACGVGDTEIQLSGTGSTSSTLLQAYVRSSWK